MCKSLHWIAVAAEYTTALTWLPLTSVVYTLRCIGWGAVHVWVARASQISCFAFVVLVVCVQCAHLAGRMAEIPLIFVWRCINIRGRALPMLGERLQATTINRACRSNGNSLTPNNLLCSSLCCTQQSTILLLRLLIQVTIIRICLATGSHS